jgi:hypothetical protein
LTIFIALGGDVPSMVVPRSAITWARMTKYKYDPE